MCIAKSAKRMGMATCSLACAMGFRGEFLNALRRTKGLKEKKSRQGRLARFHQYDRLADHFEAHCDVEKTLSYLERGTI